MAVIEYAYPQSWDDKGMDWKNPDPSNFDYIMALRLALMERMSLGTDAYYSEPIKFTPYRPVLQSSLLYIIDQIRDCCTYFVNMEFNDYQADFSDFPKMWTYADLVNSEGCHIGNRASLGMPCRDNGEWLIAIKNALDKLTVVQPKRYFYREYYSYGNSGTKPFSQAMDDAIADARSYAQENYKDGRRELECFNWSGASHNHCPRPDWHGKPEENINGYYGAASYRTHKVSAVDTRLFNRKFDIFAGVVVHAPTGFVYGASVLDNSTFDAAGTGFSEGLNWTNRVHVSDQYNFELEIGSHSDIPRDAVVPVSEFDKYYNPVRQHCTKCGWAGEAHIFLDYAVDGGFKFYSKGG